MRKLLIIIAILFFPQLGKSETATPNSPTIGVSKSLAEQRAASISDLSYDIRLNIPSDRNTPVTGEVSITFRWTGTDDIQLDFQGKFSGQCTVNGKPFKATYQNEHIIIPHAIIANRSPRKPVVLTLPFTSDDGALNRHDDYLYSLFVPDHARSVFPCFDQPDLKARFTLKLNAPQGWKTLTSDSNKLIPTYLVSFVAGKFQEKQSQQSGRVMRALYRETDPAKVAQIDTLFSQMDYSIRWLERYTGIACPFEQCNFVLLPNYQFGGMEHPGAIQFNDRRLLLEPNASIQEHLRQLELVAHETSHLWFGDMVTMKWFDDVWTKEVFANFIAAKIVKQRYPDIDQRLNFLYSYQAPALATDRTLGTHPIHQQLDNLNQAALLYGNIIYDKAPVMMRQMEALTGEESLRDALRYYLRKYAYANATWNDLTQIIDSICPNANVTLFDKAWVQEKGLPTLQFETTPNTVKISHIRMKGDAPRTSLFTPQRFQVLIGLASGRDSIVDVLMDAPQKEIKIEEQAPRYVIPNYRGDGYGRFLPDEASLNLMPSMIGQTHDPLVRYALAQTLWENYLLRRIKPQPIYQPQLADALLREDNPLVGSAMARQLMQIAIDAPSHEREQAEQHLWQVATTHTSPQLRQTALRLLAANAVSESLTDSLLDIWQTRRSPLLTANDYEQLALRLALRRPHQSDNIIATQLARTTDPDRRETLQLVSRACTPDTAEQHRLFRSLLDPKNRSRENAAAETLALLCDESRAAWSDAYVRPALEALADIQRTSSIFFPGKWLAALLANQRTAKAADEVRHFIATHPECPRPMVNKVLENAYHLLWVNEE